MAGRGTDIQLGGNPFEVIDNKISNQEKAKDNQIFDEKKNMLEEIYQMLTIHLGNPPNKFDWQIRDKKKNFIKIKNLNPNSFYNDHVGLKLDEYVCLIHCPMSDKKYKIVYYISYLNL